MQVTGPEEDLPTLQKAGDDLGVLRYIRAHKLRRPRTVLTHGNRLLGVAPYSKPSRKLSDAERLAALEQLCVAALDVGKHGLAGSCLDCIESGGVAKDSGRYRRLLAMCYESSGDYAGATEVYDGLLQENPSNGYAAKRKYCVLAAQPGKSEEG